MPLKLTREAIDRDLDIPVYIQLANHLRQAIVTGDLQPGDALPSEKGIGELTGVSREPVRKALDVVFSEGLTVRTTGWPTRVAERRQPRVMGPARYRDILGTLRRGEPLPLVSIFCVENGARWSDYSEHPRQFTEEAATALDRELLQLDDGGSIWRRRFVRRLRGRPYEIVRSAIPMPVAAGTILTDIDIDPIPGGTIQVLYENGYDPALIEHKVVGRAPNTRERELLEMQTADSVIDLLEVFKTATGIPIQAARTIMPMSSTILQFETDLSG